MKTLIKNIISSGMIVVALGIISIEKVHSNEDDKKKILEIEAILPTINKQIKDLKKPEEQDRVATLEKIVELYTSARLGYNLVKDAPIVFQERHRANSSFSKANELYQSYMSSVPQTTTSTQPASRPAAGVNTFHSGSQRSTSPHNSRRDSSVRHDNRIFSFSPRPPEIRAQILIPPLPPMAQTLISHPNSPGSLTPATLQLLPPPPPPPPVDTDAAAKGPDNEASSSVPYQATMAHYQVTIDDAVQELAVRTTLDKSIRNALHQEANKATIYATHACLSNFPHTSSNNTVIDSKNKYFNALSPRTPATPQQVMGAYSQLLKAHAGEPQDATTIRLSKAAIRYGKSQSAENYLKMAENFKLELDKYTRTDPHNPSILFKGITYSVKETLAQRAQSLSVASGLWAKAFLPGSPDHSNVEKLKLDVYQKHKDLLEAYTFLDEAHPYRQAFNSSHSPSSPVTLTNPISTAINGVHGISIDIESKLNSPTLSCRNGNQGQPPIQHASITPLAADPPLSSPGRTFPISRAGLSLRTPDQTLHTTSSHLTPQASSLTLPNFGESRQPPSNPAHTFVMDFKSVFALKNNVPPASQDAANPTVPPNQTENTEDEPFILSE